MSVELSGPKAGVWGDFATGEGGDLLDLFRLSTGGGFTGALAAAAEFLNLIPSISHTSKDVQIDPTNFDFTAHVDSAPAYNAAAKPASGINWQKCVSEFTPAKAAELCTWRGYSVEHVQWLRDNELVGCFQGNFAFPVHNAKGVVVAAHYRWEHGWIYYPKGSSTAALVVGNPAEAMHTLLCESQWDAFSMLDKLKAHEPENAGLYAAYITRSATSNTDISKLEAPHLIAVTQNDPRSKQKDDGTIQVSTNKDGRTPSEEWLHRLQSSRSRAGHFCVVNPPSAHKDMNDWIRAENPDHHEVFRAVVELAKNPILKDVRTIADLSVYPIADDMTALIGFENRFLCKGGSWMIIGPSGIGKSTLITSLCLHAAAGASWHGLKFRKPLKTLIIQSENDEGDLAEMTRGGIHSLQNDLSKPQFMSMMKNLSFVQCTDKVGAKFCRWFEEIVTESKVDLVCIDPLLAFIGDDISQQKVVAQFLVEWIQPILSRTGVIVIFIHHTGKPSKDKSATSQWSESDFSYIGLGSSLLTSWPRAVSVLIPTKQDGVYCFKNCKRGNRAQMRNQFTQMTSKDIFLRHGQSSEGLQWLQTQIDDDPEEPRSWGTKGSRAKAPIKNEDLLAILPDFSTYHHLLSTVCEAGPMANHDGKAWIASMLLERNLIKSPDGSFRKPTSTFC